MVQRIIQLVCQLISNKPGCQKVFLAWQWETEWGGEACLRFIQNIPGNLRVDSVGKETCIKTNVIFEVSVKKKQTNLKSWSSQVFLADKTHSYHPKVTNRTGAFISFQSVQSAIKTFYIIFHVDFLQFTSCSDKCLPLTTAGCFLTCRKTEEYYWNDTYFFPKWNHLS